MIRSTGWQVGKPAVLRVSGATGQHVDTSTWFIHITSSFKLFDQTVQLNIVLMIHKQTVNKKLKFSKSPSRHKKFVISE